MALTFCGCILIGYLFEKYGGQLGEIMQRIDQLLEQGWWVQAGLLGIVAVIVLGISYLVSIAVMRRKEF